MTGEAVSGAETNQNLETIQWLAHPLERAKIPLNLQWKQENEEEESETLGHNLSDGRGRLPGFRKGNSGALCEGALALALDKECSQRHQFCLDWSVLYCPHTLGKLLYTLQNPT